MKVEAADITVGRPALTSGLSLADTSCDEIPFKITCLKIQWNLDLAENLDLKDNLQKIWATIFVF